MKRILTKAISFIMLGLSALLLWLSFLNFTSVPLKGDNGWDAVYVPKVHDCWEKYKIDCIIVTPAK